MRSMERLLTVVQAIAAIGLGVSYFLPFYQTYGIVGRINYANNAPILFFWTIPVLFFIYVAPNRWLKIVFCVLSSMGAVLALWMMRFLAYFKATPLSGFFLAQFSIGTLILCWLVIIVLVLNDAESPEEKASVVTHNENS